MKCVGCGKVFRVKREIHGWLGTDPFCSKECMEGREAEREMTRDFQEMKKEAEQMMAKYGMSDVDRERLITLMTYAY